MESITTEFRNFVITHPTLKNVFGESFHWHRIPDSPKYPCIRASIIDGSTLKSNSRSSRPSTAGIAIIQLDVFHSDSIQLETAALVLEDTLHEYTGAMGAFSDCVVTVEGRRQLDEPDARSFKEIIELKVRYA